MDDNPIQSNTDSQDYNSLYFAKKKGTDCASILLAKGESFFNTLRANAYLEKLICSWQFYHGGYSNDIGFGHKINFTGEQGELVQLPVNHFRNLAQHIYVMITSNRPIMEARAINTDNKSMAQTYLANGILDYYMREKKLEECLKKAVEMAVVLGAGFVKMEWNATAGEAYDFDEETKSFNYEGEIEFSNLSPFDVVVDGTKESWNNEWILTRSFQNKYNLIAKYPELADKIRAVTPKNQTGVYRLAVFSNDDTDDIPVYEFFHKRTESMPDGRYLLFLDTDIVLLDAKMPYRVLPVFRIAPSDIMGTPYGYTPMFDIYPIQEGINSLYGTIMTNQNAFGVQNLYVPRGADIAVNQLAGSMNIIEANAKPEALNLTQTPAEIFKFLDTLIQAAETISGVNSVARGNPEASLKSGTALALVQSQALQFMSGLQQSYVQLIESVGTALIQILKDFATTPKVVALVGKHNRPLLKEFTGEDISSINRVIVDMGNPLSRSIAGRVQMAEQMLQMNLLKTPQDYFEVMNTGRLDSAFEGELSQLFLARAENEKLAEGIDVLAAPTDEHDMHIKKHREVLDDPDLRDNPTLIKIVMDHMEAHLNFLRNTDPQLLQIIGQQPLPALPAPLDQEGQMIPQPTPPQPSVPSPQGVNTPQGSPMVRVQAPQAGMANPGEKISGPGQEQGVNLPKPASPPKPFSHLPTNPQELAPPTLK